MDKPTTRLDIKKHRKTLREIGSLRRSNLPEKVKNRLRIRARQRVAKFLGLTFPCNKYPCFV